MLPHSLLTSFNPTFQFTNIPFIKVSLMALLNELPAEILTYSVLWLKHVSHPSVSLSLSFWLAPACPFRLIVTWETRKVIWKAGGGGKERNLWNICQMSSDIWIIALIAHYFHDLVPLLGGEILSATNTWYLLCIFCFYLTVLYEANSGWIHKMSYLQSVWVSVQGCDYLNGYCPLVYKTFYSFVSGLIHETSRQILCDNGHSPLKLDCSRDIKGIFIIYRLV